MLRSFRAIGGVVANLRPDTEKGLTDGEEADDERR
jgi:hypothetical protein